MKKINFIKLAILATISLFISCDATDENQKAYTGDITSYLFKTATSSLPVSNSGVSSVEIEVGVTKSSTSDRTLSFTLDPSSTGNSSQYSIDPASLIIPAGKFSTKVKVIGNFATSPVTGSVSLVLKFNTTEQVMPTKDKHTISMFRFCSTNLAGNYSVTTTYSFHDFLPNYSTNTMNVVLTAVNVANTYKVADFSGGLYSTGPYNTNYGTGTAALASKRDLTFVVNCGAISWTGETDPYGAIIPTVGAVNSYNPVNRVITISWHCLGYGEKGVSVYTPL